MRRRHPFSVALLAVASALVAITFACANGDNSDDGVPPSSVIEEVREEFPHTRTEDIAYSYQDIKEQDPDATDDEIAEWLKEAVQANEETEEWNDCLDTSPTGDGCREPRTELSDDNPLGW